MGEYNNPKFPLNTVVGIIIAVIVAVFLLLWGLSSLIRRRIQRRRSMKDEEDFMGEWQDKKQAEILTEGWINKQAETRE